MHQRLNIICGNRSERRPLLLEEIERQQIVNYMLWDGVYLPSVKASINEAHKQIVRYAKLAEFPSVMIAEDDFIGTHASSFKYYIANRPKQFDIYLSMVYLGDIDAGHRVNSFTGMTLYTVSEKYYDKFLSADPEEHIDVALSKVGGDFRVCNPFTFIQRNGWSSNTGKMEEYDSLLSNRQLFGG
jgi:hypothetical protein